MSLSSFPWGILCNALWYVVKKKVDLTKLTTRMDLLDDRKSVENSIFRFWLVQ